MFLDLSGVHATRWCSTAYPKNVLGPITASTSDLEALNRPEKCSWTYLAVALHSHQTVPTRKMFLDLVRVAVGISVARYPPHRSPRAALPHEALILDEWRQSELGGKDGGHAASGSTAPPVVAFAPSSGNALWPRRIRTCRHSRVTRQRNTRRLSVLPGTA